MSPGERDGQGAGISLAEASRLAGVSASTLKRWADAGLSAPVRARASRMKKVRVRGMLCSSGVREGERDDGGSLPG